MQDSVKPSYEINTYLIGGKRKADVLVRQDRRAGILNFTHEISLSFEFGDDNSIVFISCWEIGPGGDWTIDTAEEFEQEHPGLLKDIQDAILEKRTNLDSEEYGCKATV